MRITSGIIGGRNLDVPHDKVRPTQDKVRAALFSSLGDFPVDARVLDLFAGSGAMGLEAWSRGAAEVCWVEADRAVYAVLKKNIETLCRGGGTVRSVHADVFRYMAKPVASPFDLVLADPPYDRDGTQHWLSRLLELLRDHGWVRNGGFLVFEQSAGEKIAEKPGWILVKEKKYGDTRLIFYRRAGEPPKELP
ncbi:MAG TPA: 16S rRNA (guanine(966)-N(2))-methyltransferase RsmD [Verrucomicrobia bacterium]|nr:MAG: 16S rRNA (guanine(966)-N(2))-methyltransferase RsmD [Lentisphaerae bacterium GWF2_57_35]HBA83168.1 16S rRNA (guanine(966)-N(2))-methyltransferase RsmD [Verrucomicrobiota bacterium]